MQGRSALRIYLKAINLRGTCGSQCHPDACFRDDWISLTFFSTFLVLKRDKLLWGNAERHLKAAKGKLPIVMAEGENEVRWDGLCSRDPTARETALENIRQVVLRKTEYLRSVKETLYRPPDGLSSAVSLDGMNKLLAHLLMLSKRCPFKDVRERSGFILRSVEVRALLE